MPARTQGPAPERVAVGRILSRAPSRLVPCPSLASAKAGSSPSAAGSTAGCGAAVMVRKGLRRHGVGAAQGVQAGVPGAGEEARWWFRWRTRGVRDRVDAAKAAQAASVQALGGARRGTRCLGSGRRCRIRSGAAFPTVFPPPLFWSGTTPWKNRGNPIRTDSTDRLAQALSSAARAGKGDIATLR